MSDKAAIETMTNQERFNSAVIGWINEATEAFSRCGDRIPLESMHEIESCRVNCSQAFSAMMCNSPAPKPHTSVLSSRDVVEYYPSSEIASLRLTDVEREAILNAARAYELDSDEEECVAIADTLRNLLERLK